MKDFEASIQQQNDFVDYLTKLAPEGETLLIVKQKPKLKDGELQFHDDGAIKATWPAYLPTKTRKQGQAWYANTGSFIIDRFTDGHVSASAANCEYVLAMMLDDVGDPEKTTKTPSLPPTWIIETSEGSFQWGYAFTEEQPTKDEFSAAISAITQAGYGDPAAINPVRNFRIPGSVNIKPGKNNFVAQLREFHPERQYTLGGICEALGVTPDPVVPGSAFRPIRLSDDGTDDVLIWLSENGKLLSLPNREGWAGVICPNSEHHSDGNPEGRYMPATRSFCCYHSHCMDLHSREFLDWVAEQGGPAHTPGLRDELLAMTMDAALSKLTPTEAFPDAAAATIAEVERKEMGRLAKAEWFERFAYLQDDDAYFDMLERRYISRSAFNATFRHITCKSIRTGRVVEASIAYDELRQEKGARVLVGMTYAAGEDVLCAREGLVYANRWRDARPVANGGDAGPWLRHVERMIPDAAEREHVLNVMACKVQHANKKINHAILHAGKPGSGKDTMWAPFFWAIGGDSLANVYQVKNDEITSQWGYSLESEVIVIQELRQAEAKDRRALENQLKPIIAAPPELLTVNRKGMHPYQALNRVFVLAFSNERVAINLPSDDRRWFVVWSEANRMSEAESSALWAWYHSGGFAAVAAWLHARDVSAFNPGASPMMTEAKAIMVEAGMSGAESFLVELMRGRVGEFAAGVAGAPWHALCDRLQGQAPAGMKIVQGALLHAFKEAGWTDMGRLASRAHGTKKHIFCAPEMADRPKSELRDMVESPPASLMRLVK